MTELTIMGRVHIKKIIEFSIKDLTQKKIIKRHVVFLGFLSHLEQKKFWKFFTLKISQPWYLWTDFLYCWLSMFKVEFFCFGPCLPQNSTQKTNNQQSDPVSSQLSWQFSYAGLWSWEKIKPAKLAFDNI